MDRKYILTDEVKVIDSHMLHRIQAVRNFGSVKAGDLGGWIESEENLSHEGYCWVHNEAKVFQHAKIYSHAQIHDCALMLGHAEAYSSASIYDRTAIHGDAQIYECACVRGNSRVYDHARVFGRSDINSYAEISGCAQIHGYVTVTGKTRLRGDADIKSNEDFVVIGSIGSRNGHTTFARSSTGEILVFCGCFSGTLKEFEEKVHKTHGNSKYAKTYQAFTNAVKVHFDILKEDQHE